MPLLAQLKCSKSGLPVRCFTPLQQCDNNQDCPNAEDEDAAVCMNIDCRKSYRVRPLYTPA